MWTTLYSDTYEEIYTKTQYINRIIKTKEVGCLWRFTPLCHALYVLNLTLYFLLQLHELLSSMLDLGEG